MCIILKTLPALVNSELSNASPLDEYYGCFDDKGVTSHQTGKSRI